LEGRDEQERRCHYIINASFLKLPLVPVLYMRIRCGCGAVKQSHWLAQTLMG